MKILQWLFFPIKFAGFMVGCVVILFGMFVHALYKQLRNAAKVLNEANDTLNDFYRFCYEEIPSFLFKDKKEKPQEKEEYPDHPVSYRSAANTCRHCGKAQ